MEGVKKVKFPSKAERLVLFGSKPPGPRNKPVEKEEMKDLQNQSGKYLFPIQAVGVSNVKYPIGISSSLDPAKQQALATFSLTASLSSSMKGTNMSRFIEQLEETRVAGELTADFESLTELSRKLAWRLNQQEVCVRVEFPLLFARKGPSTHLEGLNHAQATMEVNKVESSTRKKAILTCAVTTLCPCSKEISEYSAHNQRGYITMEIELNERYTEGWDWKADLLEAAESNASALIHPVLKRPDEKMVTENAYENPRFVEDMVRLVAADLYEIDYIDRFRVECRNEESIHLHDAYAELTVSKNT
ncbi:GTP cyclohydrolase FolE2 [Planococcus antarcticus]|uniref:GTP cyclohydrolase FolE2 n=1 Tax=Planococcus antarcticus DSM 14505 TaxID=1185653 RepID=A0ABN4RCZ0_9BACL|nr:GTP cyclohydrolase [Planococcus antarcticus DSM 14505]